MAQFEPKKLNIGEINGGNRFNNGDGVSAEAINAPIEAALYAEEIAKEAIGVKEQVQDHEERIAQTEYDTKMLYAIASQKGLYAVEEVEQAYTSRVTADGQNIVDGQKTPVTLIKGSTVRCENLIPFPYKGVVRNVGDTFVTNGITYKVNNDGSITANGTSTGRAECLFIPFSDFTLPLGTYTASGNVKNIPYSIGELQFAIGFADGTSNKGIYLSGTIPTKTFEITGKVNQIFATFIIREGQTVDNITFKPMLNAGSTALPYQPYFTDLKHAKIDSIVSTGRNLWNSNDSGIAGRTFIGANEIVENNIYILWAIPVPKNTPITFSIKELGTAKEYVYIAFANDIEVGTPVYKTALTAYYANWDKRTTNSGDNKYLLLCTRAENVPKDMMINIGDTALPYEPYIQETYQLPETLELPKFDRFNPQTGEITRGTGYATSETGFTEEEIATYDSAIVSLDGKTLECKLATPTVEKFNAPKSYPAYNQGNETAVLENEEFGAIPTITNEYIVVL